METSKPWSVSGAIRGFYDDNYAVRSSNSPEKRGSFGFEFHPGVAFHIPKDQTFFGGSYDYTMKYYEDRTSDPIDQSHTVLLNFDHRFSERYRTRAKEEFVYADEPELVDQNVPLRQDSSGMRNVAKIEFFAVITERVGTGVGYQNNWFNYTDSNGNGPNPTISRSALLDRIEHLIHIDGRYQYTESIIALLGYQFGIINYTGDDIIAPFADYDGNPATPDTAPVSDDRDNFSHYLYVGADANLSEKLSGSARIGVQFTDFTEANETALSPYVDIAASYTYLPGCALQAGVRHFRNATDVSGVDASGDVTTDQETTSAFVAIDHRITPRLRGTGSVQFQDGKFHDGAADGQTDLYFIANLGLDFEITKNLFAEGKYNFDRLDSERPGRSFTRNRVSVGLRAKY